VDVNVTLEVNRRPGRLWQFLQFPVTRIVIAAGAVVAVAALVEIAARAMGLRSQSVPGLLVALLLVAATLATYYVYVRVIERRAVVELGTPHALAAVGAGFLVGGLLFGATMLALVCAGIGSVTRDGGLAALLYPLVAALVAAVSEEVLIRGVFFRILEERLGSWLSLALTAALFGGLHAFNTGATVTSSVAVALEAGVLLAAVYMYSRRLWMPIGLHAGWNFTEGGIFGASVSGHDGHGMLASRFHGPDLLTGGEFGPEASVVAVAVCVALGAVFVMLAVRRGHVVPPQWRRNRDRSSAG
jgi:CAAX protease family protein